MLCVKHTVFTQWGSLASAGAVLIFVSSLYTALYIHSLVCSGPKQSLFGERGESGQNSYRQTLFMGTTSELSTPAPPH